MLNLSMIEKELSRVESSWPKVQQILMQHGVGKKDIPFNRFIKNNMLAAYFYLDYLVRHQIDIFSRKHLVEMLELNHRVHYGENTKLMLEFSNAVSAAQEKFYITVPPISRWVRKNSHRNFNKLAGEVYVAIIGQPQVFVEGNHRTGSLIGSYINLMNGKPPFVLSVENALAYFHPSAMIKKFSGSSTWRGSFKLPKYKRDFGKFWLENTREQKYLK